MFLVCSTNPMLGLGGYKHLGLTEKYRASLKQLLKNRWIRGYSATPYPCIRSTYPALSRILLRSGGVFCCYSNTCRDWRATGPSAHLWYFFLPVYQAGLSRLPVARHRTLILVKLLGIHSLLLSSIYNYKLAYLFGTCTPVTGSPNERLSSQVIFLLRKESVLRCFGAHSCCQQTYLYRQNPVKGLAY